jgi:hypothetical protein
MVGDRGSGDVEHVGQLAHAHFGYVLRDKVWVRGPGSEPWEVYVVKADSDVLTKPVGSSCCVTESATGEKASTGCC